ncbi:MAG: OsmC family protein [Campylobacterales bacterium]|nr:OsmC family protein [Campylobacterales bacterium]
MHNAPLDEQSHFRSLFRMFVTPANKVKFYTRNQSLIVDDIVAFDAKAASLSCVELLVASFISSYLLAIKKEAKKAHLSLGEMEVRLTCTMKNPLALLGVIGYEGEAKITALEGKLYIYSEEDEEKVRTLCQQALPKSLIYSLLAPQIHIHLEPEIFRL